MGASHTSKQRRRSEICWIRDVRPPSVPNSTWCEVSKDSRLPDRKRSPLDPNPECAREQAEINHGHIEYA